ncbi:MAG: response regulator [Clostridiales bacterium]|jgi:signal transduction histidine kinase|nr:response regulator [Clostridiales bacterium]
MRKIKRLLNHYLFSEDLSRDARALNMICFIGFFSGVATLVTRWAEGLSVMMIVVMIAFVASTVVLFFIANHFKAHEGATWITLVAMGDIIFPVTFFLAGGVNGALGTWFVLSMFAVFFFSSGKKMVVFAGIHILAIIACFTVGTLYPEWITPLTPAQRLAESILAVFACGFSIGIAVKYILSIYDGEQKKAEAASRTKSTFLSTMSHEMRTPMNAIIGMLAIAKSTDDPQKKAYALDRIEEASEHLLGVINDILDMSKIEADKLQISPVEFNFARTLQKVKTIIGPRVDEKDLSFSMIVAKNIPETLVSDDQRLTQVMLNLLSNAVKFTDKKGTVTLEAVLLGETDGIYEIRVEVADTGIGLSEEQIGRLFGSFEQAESGTARKYGGTGLGLAISKSIVGLLGGRIWVESTPGEGSRFFFTFKAPAGLDAPVSGAAGAVPAAGDRLPEASIKGKRILLAEDIEINREIVTELLEPTGVEIECAVNGAEALEKFRAAPQRYDLILMDCMMPEMDGYEATQRIRALPVPRARLVPIIAMTANVFKEDIDKCLASGMNGHIGKPIDYGKLWAILRDTLAES